MISYIRVLLTIIVCIASFGLFAQSSPSVAVIGTAEVAIARNLKISCNKTTMLVFPAAIQSADRGRDYVLARRVKGSENVLKVKAGTPDFEPSSLTVITADGQVYVFRVSYAVNPSSLLLDFRGLWPSGASVHFEGRSLNSAEMAGSAAWVKRSAPFIKRVQADKYGVEVKLESIYIHRDVLFFKFRLHNESSIAYRLSAFNFFVRDLKTAKRTAVQDNELQSLYMHSWGVPEDDDGQVIVVALPRFTIADNKKLVIELMEKKGDRAISLDLRERKLRLTKSLYHH